MPDRALLLTCEHGGYDIPPAYRHLFIGAEDVLRSHRGWDPGALDVARALRDHLQVPLIHATVSRLLVELNRSADSPQLFSQFTRPLPEAERQAMLSAYYQPYRQRVEAFVTAHPTLHISVHSFTDVLDGDRRELEIGVLYDPARPAEVAAADAILARLSAAEPTWRLARNAPYAGTDDGLTTHLRTRVPDPAYAGLELELRQGLLADRQMKQRAIAALTAALQPLSA